MQINTITSIYKTLVDLRKIIKDLLEEFNRIIGGLDQVIIGYTLPETPYHS